MIHIDKTLTQGGESWPKRPRRRELISQNIPFVCSSSKINISKSPMLCSSRNGLRFGRWSRFSMSTPRNCTESSTRSAATASSERPWTAKLPVHVLGDEHHEKRCGEKIYIVTTVASGCVLGAEVCSSASTEDLTKGYGAFKKEALELDTNYAPKPIPLKV